MFVLIGLVGALYGREPLLIRIFNHRQLMEYHVASPISIFLCRIYQLKGDLIVALCAAWKLFTRQ